MKHVSISIFLIACPSLSLSQTLSVVLLPVYCVRLLVQLPCSCTSTQRGLLVLPRVIPTMTISGNSAHPSTTLIQEFPCPQTSLNPKSQPYTSQGSRCRGHHCLIPPHNALLRSPGSCCGCPSHRWASHRRASRLQRAPRGGLASRGSPRSLRLPA